MSIVAMKKIRLIAVQSQKEEILKDLMLLGCVQIDEPSEEAAEGTLTRSGTGRLLRLKSDRTTLTNALRQLNRYAPYSKGLLSPMPEVSVDKLLDTGGLEEAKQTAERILSLDVDIKSISAGESRERTVIESMEPWLSMDQDLAQTGTAVCDLMYGTLAGSVDMGQAKAALAELEADITEISSDKLSRWVAVVYAKGIQEEVTAALRPYGFSQITMMGLSGTPAEIAERSRAKLEQLAAEKQEKTDAITAEAASRAKLQLALDTLGTLIEREEASVKLLNTKSTFVFEGWLTAPDEEKLADTLSGYTCAWETEEPDPENPAEVPVKLKNNAVTEPFNMVTEMYSLPAYNGIDPNPFIMPFFALFFGIMFADMAYGLILLIAGLIVKKKAKPRGGTKNLVGLLIECGISTFLMGFLTGGFFGDAVSVIGKWFGKEWAIVPTFGAIHIGDISISLPLNLLEGNNPLYVLIGAIAIGAVHLLIGVIIGCYLKIRDGEWVDAIFNDMCWWVILIGVALMALGKGNLVLYIGIGMMVLGTVLTNKGLGRITGIFGAVYNGATGYLGDFLSYSRLMALMLAGSVIASVFNQLGSLGNANGITAGGTILFIVVFCIGHALNFGLNVIGCFVHTLRLQYLEFFGKWYRDGGKPFKPLQIKTKFFDVTKEE